MAICCPSSSATCALAELEGYITEILTRSQSEQFAKGNDLDFSYVSAEGGRFRVNVYRKDTGVGRDLPRHSRRSARRSRSWRCRPIVTKLCDYHQGMILVTGSTGTGKSTTLAAMIDHLNQTRRLNIISLEDPIEFVHRSKNSQVIQRELGTHIPSFAEGVRAAMREDPDVILVGELRDAETISMAMTAAETGHLVLGTLHTTSAVKTIDRIIDALPVEEREQTKSFLSQSLLAVVTQILVKTADGRGRKAICEVLVMTKAIAKLIQTDQTHQIPTQLQMGRDLGMQLLDQALLAAITAREIDPDDAYGYAMEKRAVPEVRHRHQHAAEARRHRRHTRRRLQLRRPELNAAPVAEIDALPDRGPGEARLGPALHRRRSAAHPPVRRPHAAAAGQAGRGVRQAGALRDHAASRRWSASRRRTAPTSPTRSPSTGRFRVNVMRQLNGMGAVFRAIPSKALTLDELKMPEAVRQLCRANNGLILVTGKTGSGKSTTLAAMIDDINTRVKGHILTIEDPIEFVHQRKSCLISQREIGVHSPSFAAALHSALREDPDVILVGELRDLETMSIAVTAAEMGILVMGTLHTNGAAPTVDRMINVFPVRQAVARAHHALDLAARRGLAAAAAARRQAGPRGGAGDPGQHAGRLEPDPPGQARPARERHAGRRRIRHAHHGHRDPAAARRAPDHGQRGLQEGHQQGASSRPSRTRAEVTPPRPARGALPACVN